MAAHFIAAGVLGEAAGVRYLDERPGLGIESVGLGVFVDIWPSFVERGVREVLVGRKAAAGASPVHDSIEGIGSCPTSDDLLDLERLPAEAVMMCMPRLSVVVAKLLPVLNGPSRLEVQLNEPLRSPSRSSIAVPVNKTVAPWVNVAPFAGDVMPP